MKTCKRCGESKDEAAFNRYWHKGVQKEMIRFICAVCDVGYYAEYRRKNREKIRAYSKGYARRYSATERGYRNHLKANLKQYGMTLEQYDQRLRLQCGRCAICRRTLEESNVGTKRVKKRFGVDHSHKTGVVRGLLCDDCNHGLGAFRDSSMTLRRAEAYLIRTSDVMKSG